MDTMKNHEGYKDPTAGRAIRNVTWRERRAQDEMLQALTYRLEEISGGREWVNLKKK